MFTRSKQDQAIEALLRAVAVQQHDQETTCNELDPDLLNAYIEHKLTAKKKIRFEGHLAECASCRTGVARIIRLGEVSPFVLDSVPGLTGRVPRKNESKNPWSPFARFEPQWAIAALAVFVIAFSLTLFLTRRSDHYSEIASRTPQVLPPSATEQNVIAAKQSIDQPPDTGSTKTLGIHPRHESQVIQAKNMVNTKGSTVVSASSGKTGETKPSEPITISKLEDNRPAPPRTSASGAAAQPESAKAAKAESENRSDQDTERAAAAGKDKKELPHLDSSKALKLPPEETRAAEISLLKPGVVESGVTHAEEEKSGAVRTTETVSSTTGVPGTSLGRRRGLAQPAPGAPATGSKDRDTNTTRTRGSSERKAGNKVFWLIKGTWTDREYKVEKSLPVVTLIWNSDQFKERISKETGLSSYLSRFTSDERTLIVFKGIVYIFNPDEKSSKSQQ